MFQKLLIANRGEIAVRIIRACREMGIKTVAVYSQADADALHTQLADESICIGKAEAKDSYLNMERILSATIASGADAIHPGFGFLSENSKFAELCEKCNIAFIGPSAKTIEETGNKSEARNAMVRAGVPVIPGTKNPIFTAEAGRKFADEIGYPVMITAKNLRKIFKMHSVKPKMVLATIPCILKNILNIQNILSFRYWRIMRVIRFIWVNATAQYNADIRK